MPKSPGQIATMRQEDATLLALEKLTPPQQFWDTLDKVLSWSDKNTDKEWDYSINLGTVYDKFKEENPNSDFTIEHNEELTLAEKVKREYQKAGWKKVSYMYPKSLKGLNDIEMHFTE